MPSIIIILINYFVNVLGANFCAGFVAGTLAAAATCPLDVAKTRRQIEKDPARALRMTTRQTLVEIWRDGGMKGLFIGVGPRVGRAGPSVRNCGIILRSSKVPSTSSICNLMIKGGRMVYPDTIGRSRRQLIHQIDE